MKTFDEATDTFAQDYLINLLEQTGGNVTRAADLAKKSRTHFYKMMRRYGVKVETKRDISK